MGLRRVHVGHHPGEQSPVSQARQERRRRDGEYTGGWAPYGRRVAADGARLEADPHEETVLSRSARCSHAPKKWLPIHHRFRTLRVSWSENQGLARFVRNAEPDPSPKCEHFLQIEIPRLTQQRIKCSKRSSRRSRAPELDSSYRRRHPSSSRRSLARRWSTRCSRGRWSESACRRRRAA